MTITVDLPVVGADTDDWGAKLNLAIGQILTGVNAAANAITGLATDLETTNGNVTTAAGTAGTAVATATSASEAAEAASGRVVELDAAVLVLEGAVADVQTALGAKVDNTDARLSDAREPLTHSHPIDEVTDLAASLTDRPTNAAALHKAADETVTGVKTFSVYPLMPDGSKPATWAWNNRPVIYAVGLNVWPATRVIPSGYTGPVDYNSEAYPGCSAPGTAVAGDGWIRRNAV